MNQSRVCDQHLICLHASSLKPYNRNPHPQIPPQRTNSHSALTVKQQFPFPFSPPVWRPKAKRQHINFIPSLRHLTRAGPDPHQSPHLASVRTCRYTHIQLDPDALGITPPGTTTQYCILTSKVETRRGRQT